MIRHFLAGFNPNKYDVVRELSLLRLSYFVLLSILSATVVFWLLLYPSVFESDDALRSLSATTNITLNAKMEQSSPTYLVRNPDILVSASGGEGFITITPSALTVNKYIFFAPRTYPWAKMNSLSTISAESFLSSVVLFLLPSLIIWTSFILIVALLGGTLMYTLVAFAITRARVLKISYLELWKISLLAAIPACSLFALIPILRLGLPLWVLAFLVVLTWLVYAVLATSLFAQRSAPKGTHKSAK